MKRLVIFVCIAASLAAALPTIASARHRSHRSRHARHASTRAHHRASRVRHERFGQDPQPAAGSTSTDTTTTTPPPSAGTVASFTGGILTIKLNDAAGTMVSGAVTDATRVSCEGQDESGEIEHHDGDRGRGGPGSGDGGRDGSGDENGDGATQSCAITPGETVQSARLALAGSGAAWDEVELLPASTTTTTTTTAIGSGD